MMQGTLTLPPLDARDWVALLGAMLLWVIFLVLWSRYTVRVNRWRLQQLREVTQWSEIRVSAVADILRERHRAIELLKQLQAADIYDIATDEQDELVLCVEEFLQSLPDGGPRRHYTARELMAMPRAQRDAILRQAAEDAAAMGLYSEEWFSNEQVPYVEDVDDVDDAEDDEK